MKETSDLSDTTTLTGFGEIATVILINMPFPSNDRAKSRPGGAGRRGLTGHLPPARRVSGHITLVKFPRAIFENRPECLRPDDHLRPTSRDYGMAGRIDRIVLPARFSWLILSGFLRVPAFLAVKIS